MTTLKPQLVRADTLDLQDHDAPSAKDHTRQPAHPAPYGQGPAAPHQQQALRHAEYESYHDQRISPRVSEENEQNFYEDHDDELEHEHMVHDGHSSGINGAGHDYEDGEQMDDDLDDDLMDKMSSSPSISDGKYTLPPWPQRSSSIESECPPSSFSPPTRGDLDSSSPYTDTLEYLPFPVAEPRKHAVYHHRRSEYATTTMDHGSLVENRRLDGDNQTRTVTPGNSPELVWDHYATSAPAVDLRNVLLPENDPMLRGSDDRFESQHYDNEDDWEDADELDSSEDDDHSYGHLRFTTDPRFLDSGWGGECLRETEDIDFEFVYALHTFVATVEGQANATKGDTMVLLDDSNSYWWLVRVVKDGSIGYLPAEHIETPTERLARLNKHRNIDLSASMLGDNPEKSRNPLKKAMRRRNAKTVQFAPPTYYEPSEYEPSDDEEERDEDSEIHNEAPENTDETERHEEPQEAVAVAPAPLTVDTRQPTPVVNGVRRVTSDDSILEQEEVSPVKIQPQSADVNLVSNQNGDVVNRSRKGVVRNTDSFFKDDSVETKKISLTPRLLRGEPEPVQQVEPDVRQRPSLENAEKTSLPEERAKDDKKKKEKKGMLSGLFKRKDKTPKQGRNESDDGEKVSEDSIGISPQSKESVDSLIKSEPSPERRPSKLQKTPPVVQRPDSKSGKDFMSNSPTSPSSIPPPTEAAPAPPDVQPIDTAPEPAPQRANPISLTTKPQTRPMSGEKASIFAPITAALRPSASASSLEQQASSKPIVSRRAKNRFAIDESDSEDDRTPTTEQHYRDAALEEPGTEGRILPTNFTSPVGRSIESRAPDPDTLKTSIDSSTSASDDLPSPAIIQVQDSDAGTNTTKDSPSSEVATPSTSRSTPTWSDSSLRTYMDNDQSIKDLLIIVNDNSNVTPVGADHPLVSNLFMSERSRLVEMQSNLDSLLTGWMSKKNSALLTR